jgi:hypothetical protein
MVGEHAKALKNLGVWGIVLILVLAFTTGLFLSFRPEEPKPTFWIVFVDILVMELASGLYFAFTLKSPKAIRPDDLPTAMHISIATFMTLLFSVTILVDLLFLFVLTKGIWGSIFLWLVLLKWLILITISVILWITGRR